MPKLNSRQKLPEPPGATMTWDEMRTELRQRFLESGMTAEEYEREADASYAALKADSARRRAAEKLDAQV